MSTTDFLGGPLAQAIGLALLHTLWQGAIVAGVLAGSLASLAQAEDAAQDIRIARRRGNCGRVWHDYRDLCRHLSHPGLLRLCTGFGRVQEKAC